jgi:aryl-alcohol dehydrogenase-like predicted oxidoreductase
MTATAQAAGTFTIGGDRTVNRMGFGAMRITGPGIWGEPIDPDECRRVLRRCIELGINLIDTADSYGPEVSERLIGETLYPYPRDLVIATKGGLTRPGPNRWERDCSPKHLRQAIEGSLRRLRVAHIELYQLHAVDPEVPYAESVGTLADLKHEGKIHHIGVCNVGTDDLEEARAITEIVSVQNRYSVFDRDSQAVLEQCERQGLAFLPWRPVGGGEVKKEAADTLEEIAKAHDATPLQIALAWLLQSSPVHIPIPGTSKVSHLEENVAAAAIELTDDELERLNDLGRI